MPVDQFVEHLLPSLLSLASDPVPNVRVLLAKALRQTLLEKGVVLVSLERSNTLGTLALFCQHSSCSSVGARLWNRITLCNLGFKFRFESTRVALEGVDAHACLGRSWSCRCGGFPHGGSAAPRTAPRPLRVWARSLVPLKHRAGLFWCISVVICGLPSDYSEEGAQKSPDSFTE